MTVTADLQRDQRLELQTSIAELELLKRAAAMKQLDLPSFVLEAALPQAERIVAATDRVTLSERDSLRILELLETPPPPPARLVEAARLRLKRE